MTKIEGRITMLVNREYTEITLKDVSSNITFATVTLTPEQTIACLSRQGYVECEIELRGLENVGKTMEHQKFDFEIPVDLENSKGRTIMDKLLGEYAQSLLSDGWIAERYFNSHDSFFTKDGKKYARCTIRRWV